MRWWRPGWPAEVGGQPPPPVVRGLAAATLALLVAGAGCRAEPVTPQPRPEVRLGLTQLLPEEGSRNALLRVENEASRDLHVTAVGIGWAGYGPAFTRPADAVVPAGATLDLRLRLPPPRCSPTRDRALGTLVTADGRRWQEPLAPASQRYLRRLWHRQCTDRLVDARLSVRYGGRWDQVGTGPGSALLGRLVLVRRSGTEPVRLTGVDGSVLFDLRLPAERVLATGAARVAVPLLVLPGNRCDEHARGQATAPFDFLLRMRLGDRGVVVGLPPPLRVQVAATRMLDRACR